MAIEYGPCIFLISLCPEPQKRLLFLDDFPSHNVLAKVIEVCLKRDIGLHTNAEPSLLLFRKMLASFFNRINSNDLMVQNNKSPHWEQLINWFFHHIFVLPDEADDLPAPFLLRVGNHIFLEVKYESTFPSEILSIITEKQYPDLFKFIHSEKQPHFQKYLLMNEKGEEYLFIPEFPEDLKRQIRNFYTLLIKTYHSLEFDDKEENNAAPFVLDYLTTVKDFFDIKP